MEEEKLRDKIDALQTGISDLKLTTEVLKTELKEWRDATLNYRKNLDDSLAEIRCTTKENGEEIKEIILNIAKLPCDKRTGLHQSVGRQVAFMWIVLSVVVIALLKELFIK